METKILAYKERNTSERERKTCVCVCRFALRNKDDQAGLKRRQIRIRWEKEKKNEVKGGSGWYRRRQK